MFCRFKSDSIVIESVWEYWILYRNTWKTKDIPVFQIYNSLESIFDYYGSITQNLDIVKFNFCDRCIYWIPYTINKYSFVPTENSTLSISFYHDVMRINFNRVKIWEYNYIKLFIHSIF